VRNGARSVFGKLFDVSHHHILIEIGILSDLVRVDYGQDEKNAEDQAEDGGYDFLCFGLSRSPSCEFFDGYMIAIPYTV
jgi:hypothetical protein